MKDEKLNSEENFTSFAVFYPFYLSQHANVTCRRLHFVGSCLVLILLLTTITTGNGWLALTLPLAGYGFAWFGHFFFEKNKPATFTYPLYSLIGDWVMFWQIINGRVSLKR